MDNRSDSKLLFSLLGAAVVFYYCFGGAIFAVAEAAMK
jgi:hypothetical protein